MKNFKIGSVVYLGSNPERKMTVEKVTGEGAVDVAFFSSSDDTYVWRDRFDGEMLKLEND